MRLGQLARKLSRRPAEIVEFLAEQGIRIDEGSNTRIPDDHVLRVTREFAPETLEEVSTALATEHKETKEVNEVPVPSNTQVESNESEIPSTEPIDNVETGEEKPELIKAPKVELSGLKVLGKIDLPESRKKQVPVPETESPEKEPKKSQGPGKEMQRDGRYKAPPRKNPVALQREREAQEALRKREAEAKEKKEQKKRSYQNRVKVSAPTKKARLVEEPLEVLSHESLPETPTSIIGKFLRWLRT